MAQPNPTVATRLTPEFRRKIDIAAASRGMTEAEYMRTALEIFYAAEPLRTRRLGDFALQMDAEAPDVPKHGRGYKLLADA